LQNNPADSHLVFEIISAGVSVGFFVVGLLIKQSLSDIKLAQADDKAELLAHQVQVKDALTRDQWENKQALAVHVARDEEQFEGIGRTLRRIDGKLRGPSGN
jgi:hypothetical protein